MPGGADGTWGRGLVAMVGVDWMSSEDFFQLKQLSDSGNLCPYCSPGCSPVPHCPLMGQPPALETAQAVTSGW